MSIEITKVSGDTITSKVNSPVGITEETTKKGERTSYFDKNFIFTFVGYKNVTVKSGTYNNTAKITSISDKKGVRQKFTYWMAKGVGNVKTETTTTITASGKTHKVSGSSELIEFKP